METIRLQVKTEVVDKLMRLLGQFKPEDIHVVKEDGTFSSQQKYLKQELLEIDEGNAEFMTLEGLDELLEGCISKDEN